MTNPKTDLEWKLTYVGSATSYDTSPNLRCFTLRPLTQGSIVPSTTRSSILSSLVPFPSA